MTSHEENQNSPQSSDELHRLASQLADGPFSQTDRERLERLLEEHPELEQEYLRHLTVHAYLDWMHSPPADLGVPLPATPAAKRGSRSLSVWVKDLSRDFVQQPLALAILVLVMLSGGVLAWNLSRLSPQQVVQGEPGAIAPGEPRASARGGSTASGGVSNLRAGSEHERTAQTPPGADAPGSPGVARMTRAVGATWHNPTAMQDGAALRAGQKLTLKQGLAEIAFDSGATVILEGPAELEVGNRKSEVGREQANEKQIQNPKSKIQNSCFLVLGKLFARVPPQAHGFTVHTPSMKIVDLGTEFAVEVNAEVGMRNAEGTPHSPFPIPHSTEVHVITGKVAIEPPQAKVRIGSSAEASQFPNSQPPSQILRAGQGAVSDSADQVPRRINANPARFVRELPGAAGVPPGPFVQHGQDARGPSEPLASWPQDSPLQPGDIVVVTARSQRLIKVDPKTGEQKLLAQGTPFSGAGQTSDHGTAWWSVAVEREGQVLIGMEGLHGKECGVLRVDPRNGAIKVLASGGLLKQGSIRGLTVAADGTIYAAYSVAMHAEEDHVVKIDPRSGQATSVVRFGPGAGGICTDLGGQRLLFVAGQVGKLYRLQGGALTAHDLNARVRGLSGVATDAEGRVFVASTPQSPNDSRRPREILEVAGGTEPKTGNAEPKAASTEPSVRVVATLPVGKDPPGTDWNIAIDREGNVIAGASIQERSVFRANVRTGNVTLVTSGKLIGGESNLAVAPGSRAP